MNRIFKNSITVLDSWLEESVANIEIIQLGHKFFPIVNVLIAYIPMAWIGGKLAEN